MLFGINSLAKKIDLVRMKYEFCDDFEVSLIHSLLHLRDGRTGTTPPT